MTSFISTSFISCNSFVSNKARIYRSGVECAVVYCCKSVSHHRLAAIHNRETPFEVSAFFPSLLVWFFIVLVWCHSHRWYDVIAIAGMSIYSFSYFNSKISLLLKMREVALQNSRLIKIGCNHSRQEYSTACHSCVFTNWRLLIFSFVLAWEVLRCIYGKSSALLCCYQQKSFLS